MNSKILFNSNYNNDCYQICNQCEKSIFLSVIIDHLNCHYEEAHSSSSSSSSYANTDTSDNTDDDTTAGTKRRLSTNDIDDDDENNNDDNNYHKRSRHMSGEKRLPPLNKEIPLKNI